MYAPGRYTRVTVTPGKSYVCGCDVQRYHTASGEYVNKLICPTHNQPVAVAPETDAEETKRIESEVNGFLGITLSSKDKHVAQACHANSMYCKCGNFLANPIHAVADDCAWPDKHPKPCDCRAHAARGAAPVVVSVEYWWDRLTRQWIIQMKDAEDNQVGAAEYAPNKDRLYPALRRLQDKHGVRPFHGRVVKAK